MTSLAYFLHAFRGLVVALVVLVAGASITAPGVDDGGLGPIAPTVGELSSSAPGGGLGGGLRPHQVGSSRSNHTSAGAWRESSRRAPAEVEATEVVEAEAEQDDSPSPVLGALPFDEEQSALVVLLRPALPLAFASPLSAPYFETNRSRGPPVG